MSVVTQEVVQSQESWTNAEMSAILDELETALHLMDNDAIQDGYAVSGWELVNRLRQKQNLMGPHFERVYQAKSCKICQKSFGHSNRGRKMDDHQQHSLGMSHIKDVHGIDDYAERKSLIVEAGYVMLEFVNRQAYLDSLEK